VVALVGEVLAFAQDLFGHLSLSAATTARVGGLYFFAFHHVPLAFEATRSRVHGPFLEVSVALLAVTALAAVLLFRGGRAVGERAGGGPVRRSLWGAAVAVPYAGLALFLSYVVAVQVPLPLALEGGALRVSVSHPWALAWPFAIAAVSGGLGGLWSARAQSGDRGRVASALAGGWRMLLYGLGLSLAGLMVLGAFHPDAAREYASGTVGGGARGLDLLAHHVLVLPNQSVWVLAPAAGACDGVYGAGTPVDLLCYRRVPRDVSFTRLLACPHGRPWDCVGFGSAPTGLFAFLLVPLGASVLAGVTVGSRSPGVGEAAARAALAGLVFAVLMATGSVLAGLSITVRSETGPATTTMVGPRLWPTALLALAWGVVGGVAGALIGRRAHRAPQGPAAVTGTPAVPRP